MLKKATLILVAAITCYTSASFVAVVDLDDTEKPFVPQFTWVDYLQLKGCTGSYSPVIQETSEITCSSGLNESDLNYPDEPFPVKKLEKLYISNSTMPTLKNLDPLEEIVDLKLSSINAEDLSGLKNLSKVSKFEISNNPKLEYLDGLSSIVEISKHFNVRNNNLQDLNALLNVTHFLYKWDSPEPAWGFYLDGNNNLYDISGIKNVQTRNLVFSVSASHSIIATQTPSPTSAFCVNKVADSYMMGGSGDLVYVLRSNC